MFNIWRMLVAKRLNKIKPNGKKVDNARTDFADMALFEWNASWIQTENRWGHGQSRNSLIGHINGRLLVRIRCWTAKEPARRSRLPTG